MTVPSGPLIRDVSLREMLEAMGHYRDDYTIGPLDADERRIATALLERLAALGLARKAHRAGCEIWPNYRLCKCPWEVPS